MSPSCLISNSKHNYEKYPSFNVSLCLIYVVTDMEAVPGTATVSSTEARKAFHPKADNLLLGLIFIFFCRSHNTFYLLDFQRRDT